MLPAVTVCKGVVSKTHGTFVCEFTTPSELLKPQQARVRNPFWKLTPFPFWRFGANLWSLPWILLLADGWLVTGYISLCGVETYKRHSSISTSLQKECGKRALRRRYCSSYTYHPIPDTREAANLTLCMYFNNSCPLLGHFSSITPIKIIKAEVHTCMFVMGFYLCCNKIFTTFYCQISIKMRIWD